MKLRHYCHRPEAEDKTQADAETRGSDSVGALVVFRKPWKPVGAEEVREDVVSVKETVETYVAGWGFEDEAERRFLLEKVWAKTGTYQDPTAEVARLPCGRSLSAGRNGAWF